MECRTLFVLGAGASRAAGGPLLADFLRSAKQIALHEGEGWAKESFRRTLEARNKIQHGFAKSRVDIDNVEDLFAYLEAAKLLGKLGDLADGAVSDLPHHLRLVIMRTLEQSINFPVMDGDGVLGSPYPYGVFVELLRQLRKSRIFSPVAVVSFNYDLALDYAVTVSGEAVDYMLPSSAPCSNQSIVLLKPHGSLNWIRGSAGGRVVSRSLQIFPSERYRHRMGHWDNKTALLDTMELMCGPEGWGERIRPEPIIIPPSWNKSEHYDDFRPVWRCASDAFSTAENIFVVGYSLPPSDHFFQSFFALSTLSDTVIDKLWVFDPADVSERFERLVGPAILQRRGVYQHEKCNFADAILFLGRALELDTDSLTDELRRSSAYLC